MELEAKHFEANFDTAPTAPTLILCFTCVIATRASSLVQAI